MGVGVTAAEPGQTYVSHTSDDDVIDGWYLVELMGHRRLAGQLSERQIAGEGFLRLDVPAPGRTVTQYYRPGVVYALTPITEDTARRMAARSFPEPVQPWELEPAKSGDGDLSDGWVEPEDFDG
jgi:hypothetical protein